MNHFFLPPEILKTDVVEFPEEISHQISRVLRLKEGEKVIVLDGLGKEYTVQINQVNPTDVSGTIIAQEVSAGEPKTNVNLIVALTQREKFEWILQKCTEIGVSSITPMITSRSLIQKPAEIELKYSRWQKIIREAAEQSHRGVVPKLNQAIDFREVILTNINPNGVGIFLWEEEDKTSLKDVLSEISSLEINLVVGPEGGFTKEEAQLAQQVGYKCVSLGKRILRMETAAILSCGLVLYELG